MPRVFAYCRVSTDEQSTSQQVQEIQAYCYRNELILDETIEVTVSSRKSDRERELDKLDILDADDTLIVTALDRLGRSTLGVLNLLEKLGEREVVVHIINERLIVDKSDENPMTKLTLTILSAFSELERSFISTRTKSALAQKKADGVILGRPKGSKSKSQYDKDETKILELVSYGVPVSKIISQIGYGTRQSLTTWLKDKR